MSCVHISSFIEIIQTVHEFKRCTDRQTDRHTHTHTNRLINTQRHRQHNDKGTFFFLFFLIWCQQPPVGQDLIIHEVFRSH